MGIGSETFFSSVTSKIGFIVTLSFLFSASLVKRAARSNCLSVCISIRGPSFSSTISSSAVVSIFLGFLVPFTITATRSLSSTFGFIINFSFNATKGFITYINYIFNLYKFLQFYSFYSSIPNACNASLHAICSALRLILCCPSPKNINAFPFSAT